MDKNPFEVARQFVWNGKGSEGKKERFLCHALLAAVDAGLISEDGCDAAIGMIQARLGEHRFVEGWLCNEAGIRLGEMTPEGVQFYRFRWLNHLEQLWNQGERT